jgi:PPOX class probable F420-dependent enzyme
LRGWSSRRLRPASPRPRPRLRRTRVCFWTECTHSRSELRRSVIADLNDDVRRALGGQNFWSLATVNPDGTPQSTVVWVAEREGKIVVNTALGRKKPRNLERNPHVALAWFSPDDPYANISIQGRVAASYTGDQAEADIDALAKKYLDVDSYPNRREGEHRITYLIEPTHIRTAS